MTFSLRFRAAIVSAVLFAAFLGVWHLATRSTGTSAAMSPEYAKLMGLTATQGKSAMPGPSDVGAKLWEHLKRPFYDTMGRTTRAWASSSAIPSGASGLGICWP